MTIFFLLCRRFSVKAAKMVKVLNVAEKNDAAKSISEVMTRGHFNRREGFSRFNKIYEFEYNILNQRSNMVMTSVSGHLLGLDFVGQYKKWNSCSPLSLFDKPVEKYCPDNYIDIKRTLEREVRGAQFLVIWTDCDREGENIGFEVIQVCKAIKPNIQVYRAKFSEITPQAIDRACRNLIPPDKRTSDAVDVRSELDLRIGAAFTRFQTKRLQKIFPDVLSDQLISYGSCQFPTLGFVVERYKQVQAFIAEPFWKLKVQYKSDEASVDFNWKRNRLFDYMACFVLYQHCLESPVAKVIDVRGKSKSKWRPVALDTVELEKLASRKLRISAKETMRLAEKLYTSGLISYPRTETNMFAKEIDLAAMVEHQTRDPNWGEFAQRVSERGPTPRNGNKTDNAHPPIHPIKYTATLQGDEKKIYDFIVRHFLACCYMDAQGFETTIELNLADELFTAQGLMITAKNYLEVYTYEKWNAKEIPVFEKGDEFEPSAIEMNNGETSPPPLLSEADLIALMDKHGIGTDATHADHIETIKSRNYVGVKPDGRFVPGQLGMGLVEGYDAMGFEMSKPHLRSELEADLKKICEGTKQKQAVLDAQVKKYKDVFVEAIRQAEKIDEALAQFLGTEAQPAPVGEDLIGTATPVMKCPICKQDMLLKPKKDNNGYYIGCMGFPDCKNAVWLPASVTEASVDDQTCSMCGPDVHLVNLKFKRGSVPPTVPLQYSGCVAGCDDILTVEVGIRPPRSNTGSTQTSHTGSSHQPNTDTRNPRGRKKRSSQDSGNSTSTLLNPVGSRSMSTVTHQHTNNNTNNLYTSNQNIPNTSNQTNRNMQNQNTRNFTSNQNNQRTQNSSFSSNQSQNQNQWSNDSRTSPLSMGGNSRVPLSTMTGNAPAAGDCGESNAVVCNCGNDAIQLTVRKEGPNTGRQFYKCSSSACNFFLWSDEAGNNDQNSTPQSSNRNTNNSYTTPVDRSGNQNTAGGTGDGSQCQCGQHAKLLTVQKEGPNKGRQFYACPAPRGEGCCHFQWADEDPGGRTFNKGPDRGGYAGGVGHGRGGGAKKRSASSEGGAPARKAKKCGLCGVEGHTKRTCPHK